MATARGDGLRLSSPAVAEHGAVPGEWLDRFMTGARQRGYRVDFIAVHWYGSDFDPRRATGQLRTTCAPYATGIGCRSG